MSPEGRLAASEGFGAEADRRKRLGQFFTGIGLGRVLAAIGSARTARSIIDPMEGSGDLIAACRELGAARADFAGIEIDPIAHRLSSERLPAAAHLLGSSFDPSILRRLPRHQWDLVIANPPYVRYQSMSKGAGKDFRLPGAVEVRNGLLASLKCMTALDSEDRRLFGVLAANYSGLADLAVASWILCASMVKVGGRLALVVPESWLSRDYSAVVHYLLLRWFRIEQIVEDEHAAWFKDAQVKTNLLVARRVIRRSTAFGWGDERFVRSRVAGTAAGSGGPIARLYPGKPSPEICFARSARRVLTSGDNIRSPLLDMRAEPLAELARLMRGTAEKQKWLSAMGETVTDAAPIHHIPSTLAAWIDKSCGRPRLVTLKSLGVSVGQGLRTGANGFFYATVVSENNGEAIVEPDGVPGVSRVVIPSACLRPVIRRQSELPNAYSIATSNLRGRVLDFRTVALPEDIEKGGTLARESYAPMPAAVAAFVRSADLAHFGKPGESRRIRALSAVAPNIRGGSAAKGVPPRYWYMLPDFAPRHMPSLIIPRVNAGNPKAFLIAKKGTLVDANFATLSVHPESGITARAVLALLNSTWCRAALEHSAAVMGGGALKVEASHLRRLPVPKLTPSKWRKLTDLGHRLAAGIGDLEEVDRLVASAVLGRACRNAEAAALAALAEAGRSRRGGHKKKKGASV